MTTVSEQLWYTWSTWGFGRGNGLQIRATSAGLRDQSGTVNMYNEYIQALLQHVNYVLPQDVADPRSVVPQQAPLCLAYLKFGQETILVHKAYTGLDGVKRPGAFFSHMLIRLPLMPSACPAGVIDFSAREAIQLWQSSFWKFSEQSLKRGDTNLSQVIIDRQHTTGPVERGLEIATSGQLSAYDIRKVTEDELLFVIQAFLVGDGRQRIYIAAPPEKVAILVWALTRCFPRTLRAIKDLTFSTYERIDETNGGHASVGRGYTLPMIVGTSWYQTPSEFPEFYYQDQGPNGFVLNCYTGRKTRLGAISKPTAEFSQILLDCLLSRKNYSLDDLDASFNKAEQEMLTEMDDYRRLFLSFHQTLSIEEITELLNKLSTKAQKLLEGENVQLAGLKRIRESDNVRRSIIKYIPDIQWWSSFAAPTFRTLRDLVNNYRPDDTSPGSPLANFPAIQKALLALSDMLVILGQEVCRKIREGIQQDNSSVTLGWSNVIADIVPTLLTADIWITLLQALSYHDVETSAYSQWWERIGRAAATDIRQRADDQKKDWTTQLTSFGTTIATHIFLAIQSVQPESLDWLQELDLLARPANEPLVWTTLLQNLAGITYTKTYNLWWSMQGREMLTAVHTFVQANRYPRSLTDARASFAATAVEQLTIAINASDTNDKENREFYQNVLSTTAPFSTTLEISNSDPDTWLRLLQGILPAILQPAFKLWWEEQGRAVTTTLRITAENTPDSKAAKDLPAMVEKQVVLAIESFVFNDSTSTLAKDAVPTLKHLANVFNNATPQRDIPIIGSILLQTLWQRPYEEREKQWWQIQGQKLVQDTCRFANTRAQQGDFSLIQTVISLATQVTDQIISIIEADYNKTIQKTDQEALTFWGEVLTELAPLSQDPSTLSIKAAEIWIKLLHRLWKFIYTPAFARWWQQYGHTQASKLWPFYDMQAAHETLLQLVTHIHENISKEINRLIDAQEQEKLNYIPYVHILLKFLLPLTPPMQQKGFWTEARIQKLSYPFRAGGFPYDIYPWNEVGKELLETWGHLPSLENSEMITPWLVIRWSELGNLKRAKIPPAWYRSALKKLLEVSPDISGQMMIDVVVNNKEVFEEVLSQFMANPNTATAAIQFFRQLVNNGYLQKTHLLAILLLAGIQQDEHVERLLNVAGLTKDKEASPEAGEHRRQELADLLEEKDCLTILEKYPLPPALAKLVEEYLADYVDRLDNQQAPKTLQCLANRQESDSQQLRERAQGWLDIRALVTKPQTMDKWLQDCAYRVRAMPALGASTKTKLRTKLLPILVEHVFTVSDLTRVIDNFGPLLIDNRMPSVPPGLSLLEIMAEGTGRQYRQDKSSYTRFFSYITLLLEQSLTIPSPQKEMTIDSCLVPLLRDNWQDMLAHIQAHIQAGSWSRAMADEWQSYLERALPVESSLAQQTTTTRSSTNNKSAISAKDRRMRQTSSAITPDMAVISVNDHNITIKQYNDIKHIKPLYIDYRVQYLETEIYFEEDNELKKYRKKEIKPVKRLQSHPKDIPRAALYDLIDDFFIFKFLKEQKINPEEYEVDENRLTDVRKNAISRYDKEMNEYPMNTEDILTVLRIFRRKVICTRTLKGERRLRSWLQKERKKAKISINYRALQIKPPSGLARVWTWAGGLWTQLIGLVHE